MDISVAFIPVRGGSKSIPLKNIKLMAGKPLVYWTAKAACECKYTDKVFICTDSDRIREAVEAFRSEDRCFSKLEVVSRSAESATDTASTEFVMLEFAKQHDFDNIALVQATSPLLEAADLDKGFELFSGDGTDSVMSVVHQYRFNWKYNESGFIVPTNYDVFRRPRRQEFSGYLVENGAFYITSKERLVSTKNRVSGNIRAVEMCDESFLEIDEPSDWLIIEGLMRERELKRKQGKAPEIKMLLTDVDGCLTDGGMYYSEKGDELKKFNTRDGMAFRLLREKGIITGIITSENVELNRRRAEKLKLDIYLPGCKDKAAAITQLSEQYHIPLENVLYVGDDINDIEALKIAGMPCCPRDANKEVLQYAKYVTKASGGEGVIREITDMMIGGNLHE